MDANIVKTMDGQEQKLASRVKKTHCSVPSCDSYLEKGLFKFPQKESLKKLWLKALNMDSHVQRDTVCIKHFRENMIIA